MALTPAKVKQLRYEAAEQLRLLTIATDAVTGR